MNGVPWSRAEDELLIDLAGGKTYGQIKEAFPTRTFYAIWYRAKRLGFSLSQGTQSLREVARETGYIEDQLIRAKRALGQVWRHATRRHGSRYLIRFEQVEELTEYLKNEKRPWANKGRWRGLTCCRECGTSSRPHYGNGMCCACWNRIRRKAIAPVEALPPKEASCQSTCTTTISTTLAAAIPALLGGL